MDLGSITSQDGEDKIGCMFYFTTLQGTGDRCETGWAGKATIFRGCQVSSVGWLHAHRQVMMLEHLTENILGTSYCLLSFEKW